MIIGTYEKLEIGQVVVPPKDWSLTDKNYQNHSNPFLVIRVATHAEYIQGLKNEGITPNYVEIHDTERVNFYEISID